MNLVACEFCDATTVASEPCCTFRFKNMIVRSLRAENAALREVARRFYRADGSFELLPCVDDVVRRRIESAREIAALRERVEVLEAFIARVADGHRYCEDGWYACPKHEEYFGHDDRCDCWCEPAREALAAAKPADNGAGGA